MDWKEYENEIHRMLADKFESVDIKSNDFIKGNFSKVDRQIDVSFRSNVLGQRLLGIVECKFYSRKIDVKIVESFLGMVEDVNANIGVIITNQGYSAAALNRVSITNVELEIFDFSEARSMSFKVDSAINKKISQLILSEYDFIKRLEENTIFIDIAKSSYRRRRVVFKEGFANTKYFAYKKTIKESARLFRDFKNLDKIIIVIPVNNEFENYKKLFTTIVTREIMQSFLNLNFDEVREDIKKWRTDFLENRQYVKSDILEFGNKHVKISNYTSYDKI